MTNLHRGKSSLVFAQPPSVAAYAAVVGKKEAEGPLRACFDISSRDSRFGQKSWELAETQMQQQAMDRALKKGKLERSALKAVFVGDLLNQCIGSSFSLRNTQLPTFGLYGACSTMAEGLLLSSMSLSAGYCNCAAALTSSHFAASERQYRFPLGYGGQRTPTAQWTVTGSGCVILKNEGPGPYVTAATIGCIIDKGICDANNMGAAMAPAAANTIRQHMEDLGLQPKDYDLIVTGDLGTLGKALVQKLLTQEDITLVDNYDDCGCMIFDTKRQDVHCGGSGCGCSAVVLCGALLPRMKSGELRRILFCGTGALLSPTSVQQGNSIPAVCHAVTISAERREPWIM